MYDWIVTLRYNGKERQIFVAARDNRRAALREAEQIAKQEQPGYRWRAIGAEALEPMTEEDL